MKKSGNGKKVTAAVKADVYKFIRSLLEVTSDKAFSVCTKCDELHSGSYLSFKSIDEWLDGLQKKRTRVKK